MQSIEFSEQKYIGLWKKSFSLEDFRLRTSDHAQTTCHVCNIVLWFV